MGEEKASIPAEESFNEDELKDIMTEIESLEADFHDGQDQKPEEGSSDKADLDNENTDLKKQLNLNEIKAKNHQDIIEKEVENAKFDHSLEEALKEVAPKSEVVPLENKSNSPQKTFMDFQVSADMEMELKIRVSEQIVNLSIVPDEGLLLSLNDGMKFTLPLSSKKAS